MGKCKKGSSTGGKTKMGSSNGGGSEKTCWSHQDHESRLNDKIIKQLKQQEQEQEQEHDNDEQTNSDNPKHLKNLRKNKKRRFDNLDVERSKKGYHRSVLLSHDNHETREKDRLRLHISKTRRTVESLKERLEAWDEIEEYEKYKKDMVNERAKRKREEEDRECRFNYNNNINNRPKKRKGRAGPQAWKLKGAARPAWEVYDYDTRYIDPHIEAHKQAREKAKRVRNIFVLYKGNFGVENQDNQNHQNNQHQNQNQNNQNHQNNQNQNHQDNQNLKYIHSSTQLLSSVCRQYLSALSQLGMLCIEAKKFKSAREAFLELIELEGTTNPSPITNARARLMRMYMEANRPDSARKLWSKLTTDTSCWIRFSAALIEYVSWNILNEDGSTEDTATQMLQQAIQSNVFCAYYLAFHDTFQSVMEYTDDVEDAPDATLQQAIEYCNSEQMGHWKGTQGAMQWIRNFIVHTLNNAHTHAHSTLSKQHLQWDHKLEQLEEQVKTHQHQTNTLKNHENHANSQFTFTDMEDDEPDLIMYAGMFRTAMDMLSDAGAFLPQN